jgi:tetratricopeptide (TPR) repeat protein
MSRKPIAPVKKSVPTLDTPDAQERMALLHVEKGRFREAVVCYKALLKNERRAGWVTGLANAYSGRAQGLADKGMLQEAIGLWRSRAELCGTALWDGPYAAWLISDGRVAEVLDYLAARRLSLAAAAVPNPPTDARSTDELAALEAQLAPALLSANQATLARLPAESLLLLHRPLALAALAAYASQDAGALETALAGIPFRSPYRDLRSLLKALVLCETDQDGARAALERLPMSSPFAPLAAALRTRLIVGPARLQAWASLTSAQQTMALDLLGYPVTLAPMLQALGGADVKLTPAALFDLVQRHARELPNALATRAWQWLAVWATRRGCDNPRLFGNPSKADQECARALAVEISGEWDHAETHWLDAVDLLESSGDSRDQLRAALVLRHVALSPAYLSSDGVLNPDAQDLLTRSLNLDPADCGVHVRLVQFWRRAGKLKRAREQLDAGLRHFPDDAALLTEAVETAVAGGAFKKASTAARRLLELDPLNRKVRVLVGNAHLSHAVKHIAASKPDAAKKEIIEAANWLTSTTDLGRMHLLQAWTEPQGKPERLRLAQLATSAWGGGLAAGWRLVREAQGTFPRVGLPEAAWRLREAGISTTQAVTPAELLALVQVLEQDPPLVRKGLDPLATWRKAIVALANQGTESAFESDTFVRLCEAFSRHQEHDLAEKFANAARKRWPDRPLFVYHAVAARFGKKGYIEGAKDLDDLEYAKKRANQSKDMRLSSRIEALFEADNPFPDLDDFGDDGEFDVPAGRRAPVPPFGSLPMNPSEFREVIKMSIGIDGGKSFLNNARKDLGDALMLQIERECAGDRKLYLSRITDLVIAMLAGTAAQLPLTVPAKIAKPQKPEKTPNPGQGNLFNE